MRISTVLMKKLRSRILDLDWFIVENSKTLIAFRSNLTLKDSKLFFIKLVTNNELAKN